MNISKEGLDLIKQFEGCRLEAYKDPIGIWTIGYGHTKGVKQGQKITLAQAEAYLLQDLASAEKAVNALKYNLNINQYSALVSFTYNCGAGNLNKLTDNNKRTLAQISARIPNFNRAAGVILSGLTRRRAAEKALFDKPVAQATAPAPKPVEAAKEYYPKYAGKSASIVTALNSLGIISAMAFRKKIAAANSITNYTGTAAQNTKMLKLLREGKLIKP